MQVAFLTLFLGLVHGVQPVALNAGKGVASIELVLDGRSAGTLAGPPWSSRIDFGAALLPHHLEARGRAADGSEAGRAEQWVNLPRPPAEVDILAEGGTPGRPGAVRLIWRSLIGAAPAETRLALDGVPLALDARGQAPIQVPAAGAAHVLSAEVRFGNGLTARKDVVLTADAAGDVATELTAIPIRTRRRAKPVTAEEVAGLAAAGHPLKIAAVEREPAEVYIVAPGLAEGQWLRGRVDRRLGMLPLEDKARARFVATVPTLHRSADGAAEIFDISPPLLSFDVGSLLLSGTKSNAGERPQVADAVAVAGLHALGAQVPRAVLLVLGGDAPDASLFDVATVRGYLAAVGVPLAVWSVHARERDKKGWGEVEEIGGATWKFRRAFLRLEEELGRQQIVWVEGRHLPQSIARVGSAGGRDDVELVATPPAAEGKAKGR